MNLKKFLIKHQMLLFKLGFWIGLIIFFVISKWKGILGFVLGFSLVCYLLLVENRKFDALIMGAKIKMYKGGKDEDFTTY